MDQSSMKEAEAYADNLTRELLEDTNNLTADTTGEDLMRTIGDDEALVKASGDAELVRLTDQEDSPMPPAAAAMLQDESLKATINPVAQQYSDDSLEESRAECGQEVDMEIEKAAQIEEPKGEDEKPLDIQPKVSAVREQEKGAQQLDEENKENARVTFVTEELQESKQADEREKLDLEVEEEAEQEQQREHQRPAAEDIWTTLHDITNSEPLHQTFKTAVNTSGLSQDVEKEVGDELEAGDMEFTKNYSDDLLMGSGEQARASNTESGGPDLADFELPPYNGSSSSGSEKATSTKQQSPAKQRKSSNQQAAQQASSSAVSSGLAPSDLTAVKNILISSYSRVAPVTHWKRPIESGIIFATGLMLIAALTFFSIISVVAYSALGIVLASGSIRIYKTSMKALNRSPETPVDHIWEKVLSLNVSMSPERMHELIDSSHANLNASFVYFKQVLLVEDKVAAIKFFLFLYSLTYIGSWFNGLTLITIVYVTMFTAPIVYEKNKTKIDEYMNLATSQVSCAISMAKGKVSALAFGGQSGAGAKKQN